MPRLIAMCALVSILVFTDDAEPFGGGGRDNPAAGGSGSSISMSRAGATSSSTPVSVSEPLIILTTGIGLLTAAMFGRRLR